MFTTGAMGSQLQWLGVSIFATPPPPPFSLGGVSEPNSPHGPVAPQGALLTRVLPWQGSAQHTPGPSIHQDAPGWSSTLQISSHKGPNSQPLRPKECRGRHAKPPVFEVQMTLSYNMHVCPWSVDMSDSYNIGARHTVHSVLQFYCEEHTLD